MMGGIQLSNPTDRVQKSGGLVQVNADGSISLTPLVGQLVSVTGSIKYLTAVTQVIPGATSYSLRNNGNTADNLIIADVGTATFRGAVTAPSFSGSLTGNATTATALATPRAINGVSFDGSSAITIPAAAVTLTGNTLNAAVTASSLTSVGVLATPHLTSPIIDSGGLTITAGALTLASAASQVIPGVTSYSIRNNGNTADNVLVTDAGAVGIGRGFTPSSLLDVRNTATGFGQNFINAGNGIVIQQSTDWSSLSNGQFYDTIDIIHRSAGDAIFIDFRGGLKPAGNPATGADAALNVLIPYYRDYSDGLGHVGTVVNNYTGMSGLTIDYQATTAGTGINLSYEGTTQALWIINQNVLYPQGNGRAIYIQQYGTNVLAQIEHHQGTAGTFNLIRYDAGVGGHVIDVSISTDTFQRFGFTYGGQHYWGPGNLTPDTFLSRGNVGQVLINNELEIVQNTGNSANRILSFYTSGDARAAWEVNAVGKTQWGDRTNPYDTNLYRSGVGMLKTDTGLTIGGSLTYSTAATQVIPGVTSYSLRNNANTQDNLIITDAGNVTLRGSLTLASAASVLTPGATSLTITNNAGNVNNIRVLDSGQVSIGGGTSASTTNLMTYDATVLPDTATTLTSVNIVGANSGLTNRADNGIRTFNVVNTWTGANGTGTFATIYGTAIHAGSGLHIHMFGTLGFAQFTGTGGASIGAGLWGGFNLLSAAGSAVSGPIALGAGIYADGATWFAGAVVTTYASIYATAATSAATSTVTNNIGLMVDNLPAGASGTNSMVWLGPILAGSIANLGLGIAKGGAWIKGNFPAPVADTSNTSATLAIYAGDNAAGNNTLTALYFYRGSAAKGYIGFDSASGGIVAGHAKTLNDLAIINDSLLADNNGSIYSANTINATQGLQNIQAVLNATNLPTALRVTGAAHTNMNNASTREVDLNFNQVKQFVGGGVAITSIDHILIQAGTFSAAAAQIITKASSLRITGAPVQGVNMTMTATYALAVDSGNIWLGSATNIVLDTVTGTKWGTLGGAAGQKQAWWNATPIVQPLMATAAAHTVDDLITMFQNLGLCRQS